MSTTNEKLLSVIPYGQENGVSMKALADAWQVSERECRKMILALRNQGFLVCSGESGYFQPLLTEEALQYYRRRLSAALTMIASLKATREHLTASGIDVTSRKDGGCIGQMELDLNG